MSAHCLNGIIGEHYDLELTVKFLKKIRLFSFCQKMEEKSKSKIQIGVN